MFRGECCASRHSKSQHESNLFMDRELLARRCVFAAHNAIPQSDPSEVRHYSIRGATGLTGACLDEHRRSLAGRAFGTQCRRAIGVDWAQSAVQGYVRKWGRCSGRVSLLGRQRKQASCSEAMIRWRPQHPRRSKVAAQPPTRVICNDYPPAVTRVLLSTYSCLLLS